MTTDGTTASAGAPAAPALDARLPEGPRPLPDGRVLDVRRLDPEADAATVHAWVVEPRARYWGMADRTVEQVREVYAYVDSLSTHHAYLLRLDGRPVALLQTYDAQADPLGEVDGVEPGDLGIHLLLAPTEDPERGFTALLAAALAPLAVGNAGVRRVVVEPDARNEAAAERLRRTGFEIGPVVDVAGKTARLAFLPRAVLEALAGSAAPGR
ncbi:GNAT family N-acetyltransferase [uncultured Pseudokineococcus sp.]|uniref:GNAT family N-acetyltransferase n=1 Tax=uncultured Pseudokineococcus sp. TaxID=1642928 RepID=UPI00262DA2BD|nr:GNAT family N-acetyltransferase [uncultured Pseudokineococcus sp.]